MAAEALHERAAAKVNLTLHIIGRRADGYHELESLVVFAGVHDRLSLMPAMSTGLSVGGPGAAACGPTEDNLILKAAGHLARLVPGLLGGQFTLVKRLPAAAGIGGGSADAAASLRLLAQANSLSISDPRLHEAALQTGADVPVCLASRAQMMHGIGEKLTSRPEFAPMFAVLANCGAKVETKAAFQAIGLKPGEMRADASHPTIRSNPLQGIAQSRNDFEPSAIRLVPLVGETLDLIRALPGCSLARMSGSGATCFGLFANCHEAARAARILRQQRPDWWIEPTLLR